MIYIGAYTEVEDEKIHKGDMKGVKKRVLIGEMQNAPNFIMRHFTLEKGGYSPYHQHKHEHEVFILSGQGIVKNQAEKQKIKAGDFVYISPNQKHQFQNPHEKLLEFLCLIPSDQK